MPVPEGWVALPEVARRTTAEAAAQSWLVVGDLRWALAREALARSALVREVLALEVLTCWALAREVLAPAQ